MKRKIIISIFSLPLLSLAFIFMPINIANAGCCVDVNTCINATSASGCASATATYQTTDCSSIAGCPTATPTTTPTATGTTPPTATGTTTSTTFKNPLKFDNVSDLLSLILSKLDNIIATIAVIFIIIGGIMYMLSGGNEAMITRAKKTLTGAIIGFAIAVASPTFLKEIQTILGGANSNVTQPTWVSSAPTIETIAGNVLNLLLSIIGIIAIISLVIGGGMYLTAYGDEKRIDTGKRTITYAIIGIVISLASLVIVRQVAHLLGVA